MNPLLALKCKISYLKSSAQLSDTKGNSILDGFKFIAEISYLLAWLVINVSVRYVLCVNRWQTQQMCSFRSWWVWSVHLSQEPDSALQSLWRCTVRTGTRLRHRTHSKNCRHNSSLNNTLYKFYSYADLWISWSPWCCFYDAGIFPRFVLLYFKRCFSS